MSDVWIKSEDELPPEGKYVIGKHNRGTWVSGTDQENVNTVIVKLEKGYTEKQRIEIKNDPNATSEEKYNASFSNPPNQYGNNEKPYGWSTFGPDYFFGQNITHWAYIPEFKK